MAVRTRFIRSVIQASKTETTKMPWTRGVIRRVALNERQGHQTRLTVPTTPKLRSV